MLSEAGASSVVLIGCHEYESLPDIPSVANNLTGLAKVVSDPKIWGVPKNRITVLSQPKNAEEVLNSIESAAARASDTLVVYFAGHGLKDPMTQELYLALPNSQMRTSWVHSALRFEYVRRAMLAAQSFEGKPILADKKILILDCCYSGRALLGEMGASVDDGDLTAIEGTCVITASSETARALAPPGEHFTAFTGELLGVLTSGVRGGDALLDMDAIYRAIFSELLAKSRPLPQQRNRNMAGRICIARNRADGTARNDIVGKPRKATSGKAIDALVSGETSRSPSMRPEGEIPQLKRLSGNASQKAAYLESLEKKGGREEVEAALRLLRNSPSAHTAKVILRMKPKDGGRLLAQTIAHISRENAEQAARIADHVQRRGGADIASAITVMLGWGEPATIPKVINLLEENERQADIDLLAAAISWRPTVEQNAVIARLRAAGLPNSARRIEENSDRDSSSMHTVMAGLRLAGQDEWAHAVAAAARISPPRSVARNPLSSSTEAPPVAGPQEALRLQREKVLDYARRGVEGPVVLLARYKLALRTAEAGDLEGATQLANELLSEESRKPQPNEQTVDRLRRRLSDWRNEVGIEDQITLNTTGVEQPASVEGDVWDRAFSAAARRVGAESRSPGAGAPRPPAPARRSGVDQKSPWWHRWFRG